MRKRILSLPEIQSQLAVLMPMILKKNPVLAFLFPRMFLVTKLLLMLMMNLLKFNLFTKLSQIVNMKLISTIQIILKLVQKSLRNTRIWKIRWSLLRKSPNSYSFLNRRLKQKERKKKTKVLIAFTRPFESFLRLISLFNSSPFLLFLIHLILFYFY